jgi:hypothetical protein
MLAFNNNIRLTPSESELLARLSRSDPSHIRTRKQLSDFVKAHLTLYSGISPEERMLRALLEKFLPC